MVGAGKYRYQGQEVLQMFQGCLHSVGSLLEVDWPCPPALTVMKSEENRNPQAAEYHSRKVATSYKNRVVFYWHIQLSEIDNVPLQRRAYTVVRSEDQLSNVEAATAAGLDSWQPTVVDGGGGEDQGGFN